jgi:tetratricopeptide (TPR) repeat protein
MAAPTRALAAATIVTAAMLLAAPAVACKDNFDRVIQDEDQQERVDWKLAQAFNNRCAAYLRQGDYGRAMQDCNQAVRIRSEKCHRLQQSRFRLCRQGRRRPRRQDYDEAIRLDPYLAGARYNRADAFEQKHQYDRALADYDEIVRIQAADARAWNNRCWTRATVMPENRPEACDD